MKSNKNKVIINGFGPLIVRMAGMFSTALIHFRITMSGVPPIKASRIINSKGIFCRGSACDLILLTSDVILALLLQVLNKPVNRCLALLSILLRMIRAIIQGISMLYRFLFLRSYDYAGNFTISKPGRLHLSALQSFSGQHRQIIMG